MSKKSYNPLAGGNEVKAFDPQKKLKDKIGKDVNLRKDIFTPEQIAKTQEVLDEAAAGFFHDAVADLERVHRACGQIEDGKGNVKALVKEIGHKATVMRGQSEALGFELVAKVSASLSDYCKTHSFTHETAIVVIRKHIDTLRVAFHEKLEGDGGQTGDELIQSLNKLIQKFSK